MTTVRARGEDVRKFILDNIAAHPSDIAKVAGQRFEITRQGVNKHLAKLVQEKALTSEGGTRNKTYKLNPLSDWTGLFALNDETAEDVIWRHEILPRLGHLPENVLNIWHYGFTEMFNNAIDHSAGSKIFIRVTQTAVNTSLTIRDDGVGIFRKIQSELNLLDVRHAILELAKGKLTTDPKHHTGEGIFFSSRMFDYFIILSDGACFSHEFNEQEDWILEQKLDKGTIVHMRLNNHTARTTKKIFDQFASGEEFAFAKTVVPVKLAQYGAETMISRSQAKRLLARVELFKTVIFDFQGVKEIGQAFADEIFRVFASQHPEMELVAIHAETDVQQMIARARAVKANQGS